MLAAPAVMFHGEEDLQLQRGVIIKHKLFSAVSNPWHEGGTKGKMCKRVMEIACTRYEYDETDTGQKRLKWEEFTCAGAGGGREVEAAEARHRHHARHVDGDGGRAGVAEGLAQALRLVVHHAAQVGAAGVRRHGGAALDEGQAGEEAEEVGAAGGRAAVLGHRADAGHGNHQQQQRDAERRSRRRHCFSLYLIFSVLESGDWRN